MKGQPLRHGCSPAAPLRRHLPPTPLFCQDESDDKPSSVAAGPDHALGRLLAWESEFLCRIVRDPINCAAIGVKLGDVPDFPSLKISGYAKKSIDDEIARNVSGSTIFMVLSINLILILVAATLGGAPCARSR